MSVPGLAVNAQRYGGACIGKLLSEESHHRGVEKAMSQSDTTDRIQTLLNELRQGSTVAADAILNHTYRSLQRVAKQMLGSYPGVRRWDSTDDVCQLAAIRLHKSLESVQPESPLHFFRLAGLHIRRTLIELARKHAGPNGLGSNHDTSVQTSELRNEDRLSAENEEPLTLADWVDFHQEVTNLPEENRDVFEVVWYGDLKLQEAAKVLNVSLATAKRRWRAARLQLGERLESSPGF